MCTMARSRPLSRMAKSLPFMVRVAPARSVACNSISWMRRVGGTLPRMQSITLSTAGSATAGKAGSDNNSKAHKPRPRTSAPCFLL